MKSKSLSHHQFIITYLPYSFVYNAKIVTSKIIHKFGGRIIHWSKFLKRVQENGDLHETMTS